MVIPKEYGGQGRTYLERFVVTEELLVVGATSPTSTSTSRGTAPCQPASPPPRSEPPTRSSRSFRHRSSPSPSTTSSAEATTDGKRWMRSSHGCARGRSEEHTSELQSLMRISYAVFCLKKKKKNKRQYDKG